jgi:hypothetical protein
MKREDLESFVGKIICLDMTNHERPVGRLLEVTDTHVVLKDPYIYVLVPAGNGMQVQALSYGAPLFEVKRLSLEFEHIIMRLDVTPQMEQAYIRQTSGVITETKPSIIVP